MFKKILAALAAAGACITTVLSAIFYVLFKQAKEEQKRLMAEAKAEQAQASAEVAKKAAELKKEDQELAQKNHSGNKLDNFNVGIDRLRKSSQRGKERNTGADNNG